MRDCELYFVDDFALVGFKHYTLVQTNISTEVTPKHWKHGLVVENDYMKLEFKDTIFSHGNPQTFKATRKTQSSVGT